MPATYRTIVGFDSEEQRKRLLKKAKKLGYKSFSAFARDAMDEFRKHYRDNPPPA